MLDIYKFGIRRVNVPRIRVIIVIMLAKLVIRITKALHAGSMLTADKH